MDSPVATNPSSSPLQDSGWINCLNNLAPWNLDEGINYMQCISEPNQPPTLPVFSEHLDPHHNSTSDEHITSESEYRMMNDDKSLTEQNHERIHATEFNSTVLNNTIEHGSSGSQQLDAKEANQTMYKYIQCQTTVEFPMLSPRIGVLLKRLGFNQQELIPEKSHDLGPVEDKPISGEENKSYMHDHLDLSCQLNSGQRKRGREICTMEKTLCKCKKTKCLKLYCECFAAGVYCLNSCACKDCFNKEEYDDTVSSNKQQIESRNPHAFTPKVVRHVSADPEDGHRTVKARHKKGCNCKKARCLKGYCDCYQSKVGCSDTCRCEGCQNAFGTKPETFYGSHQIWGNSSHEKMEMPLADGLTAANGDQYLLGWDEGGEIHQNSFSHPCSKQLAYSTSTTITFPIGNSFQQSSGPLGSHCTSTSLMPRFLERSDLHGVRPQSHNNLQDDIETKIPEDISSPIAAVEATSKDLTLLNNSDPKS